MGGDGLADCSNYSDLLLMRLTMMVDTLEEKV